MRSDFCYITVNNPRLGWIFHITSFILTLTPQRTTIISLLWSMRAIRHLIKPHTNLVIIQKDKIAKAQTRGMPVYWHHQWSSHTTHRCPHDTIVEMSASGQSRSWSWWEHRGPLDHSHWDQCRTTACVAYRPAGLDSIKAQTSADNQSSMSAFSDIQMKLTLN